MLSGGFFMGRVNKKGMDGSFIALPWSVVDSPKYKTLSSTAKALLIDLARQYRGLNNGSLVASFSCKREAGNQVQRLPAH